MRHKQETEKMETENAFITKIRNNLVSYGIGAAVVAGLGISAVRVGISMYTEEKPNIPENPQEEVILVHGEDDFEPITVKKDATLEEKDSLEKIPASLEAMLQYESCVRDLLTSAGRHVALDPNRFDECIMSLDECKTNLDECKVNLDGYKTAGNKTVYVPCTDSETMAKLQGQLTNEKEIREKTERNLTETIFERDRYKTKYEVKQAIIDDQWKECKEAAEVAPFYFLFLEKLPDNSKVENDNYRAKFCRIMDSNRKERGFACQEEIDSLKNKETNYDHFMLCEEYRKMPTCTVTPSK